MLYSNLLYSNVLYSKVLYSNVLYSQAKRKVQDPLWTYWAYVASNHSFINQSRLMDDVVNTTGYLRFPRVFYLVPSLDWDDPGTQVNFLFLFQFHPDGKFNP